MLNDRYFIDIALRTAQESKCVSLKVGAVIVKDNRIIAQGYNGTPSGQINCDEALKQGLYNREDHHEWSLVNEIHAEMNALMFAAKYGIPVDGCTMYVTHQPCDQCLKNTYQAGIKRIVYLHPYKHSSDDTLFTHIKGMSVEQFDPIDTNDLVRRMSEATSKLANPTINEPAKTEKDMEESHVNSLAELSDRMDKLIRSYQSNKAQGRGIECQAIYAQMKEVLKELSKNE